MLAGIIIFIAIGVGLALGLPWLLQHRNSRDEIDGDHSSRFSDSMRIMHQEVVQNADADAAVDVSTPLTRQAELTELRLHAALAARRRARIAGTLLLATAVLGGLTIASIVPLWSIAIPAGLLVLFLAVARFSVRSMQRSLDARAERVRGGYGEEDTEIIDLGQDEESLEISVELTAPTHTGVLWDPIPVTAPTYVSKPLVPRTVRTIDLAAPIAPTMPVVPTADHPDNDVEEFELEESGRSVIHELHQRAVGE